MTDRERRRQLQQWWVADEESEILPAERVYGASPNWLSGQRLILAVSVAAAIAAGALYF